MVDLKKKRRKKRAPRYLIRRKDGDFGPYTINEVRNAIEAREVNLGTEIQEVGGESWQPAGVFSEFRDYYETCQKMWADAELDRSLAAEENKLRAMGKVKSGAWKAIVVGIVVVCTLGAWIVYRVMHAEPTGIDSVVAIPEVSALPKAPSTKIRTNPLAFVDAVKVKRLYEAEFYNTSGVRSQERAGAADVEMDLSDDSNGIGPTDIKRIKRRNQSRIERCMSIALSAGASFKKALVTYWVRSGKVTDITVSKPAISNRRFVACVRNVVRSTKVPTFAGSGRRLEHRVRIAN